MSKYAALSWCISVDEVEYVAVHRLTNPELPQLIRDVLVKMKCVRELIIAIDTSTAEMKLLH